MCRESKKRQSQGNRVLSLIAQRSGRRPTGVRENASLRDSRYAANAECSCPGGKVIIVIGGRCRLGRDISIVMTVDLGHFCDGFLAIAPRPVRSIATVMHRLSPLLVESIITKMRSRYGIRIRRWRPAMTGCAWSTMHADGEQINWIESPYPRTPISLAIFLHEVGHHAIGFTTFKRRCEEEHHVWQWAMTQMVQLGVPPDDAVRRRVDLSTRYALQKALRRGMRNVPASLIAFVA